LLGDSPHGAGRQIEHQFRCPIADKELVSATTEILIASSLGTLRPQLGTLSSSVIAFHVEGSFRFIRGM